jgi:hypothetical protein
MKKGGSTKGFFEEEEIKSPGKLGRYIAGKTKGQDDKIEALLSDGEFVIPADVVSHIGDGNNAAGAKEFDGFLKKVRRHKTGTIKFPPKAKSLASYIRG